MKRAAGLFAAAALLGSASYAEPPAPSDVVFTDGAVAESLTGTAGDLENGRVLMNKGAGNCIACHQVTALSDFPFHGTVGPSLDGVADRWGEADLRGIVANAKVMFPETVMPAFYKQNGYIRPGVEFTSKPAEGDLPPMLSAQDVEDVVAFLLTLKE